MQRFQLQGRGMSMVFVLVVSAIFCAVATFVAINLMTNRSENLPPIGQGISNQVLVDDMLISLEVDPNKAIVMPGEGPALSALEQSEQITQQNDAAAPAPTDTPLPTAPPPTPVPDPVIFISYTVSQGDSLYGIAEAQNSAIELMALHGIDAEDLNPGATLRLPVANPAYCPGSRPYVVRDKDTVFRIAGQFNTSTEAIRALNDLDEAYTVRVTEVICIPTG